jgi:hypothetical protein
MIAKVFVCAAIAVFALAAKAWAVEHEFRYKAPDAESVALMSDFNGWKAVQMVKGSDATWSVKIDLPSGTHAYKFLVNGKDWVFDPQNPERTKVDGIENSAVAVASNATVTPAVAATVTPSPGTSYRTASTPAASSFTPAAKVQLSPTPGEISIFEVPLSPKRRADAARDENAQLAHAKVAIAVPQGFDPQKRWPILVVANTEAYSNVDSLRQFKDAAVAQGWVIVAADDVEAKPKREGATRWATIGAAFDYLTSAWPSIKDWPVACGGISGGAKNSSFLAADLARERHHVIGMLLMGCNQDMASVAYHKGPPPPGFLQAAVFLSSGKSDTIATPAQHEEVKNSLRATGFRKLRLEAFEGAHDIYQPHIGEALRWFIAQSAKAGASPTATQSGFESFFKKKP